MGSVIEVYCDEPSHEGRETRVARLEQRFVDTPSEHWMATRLSSQSTEGRSVTGPASKLVTASGAFIDEDRLYAALFENDDEEAANASLTFTMKCDHPKCGFDWQRREADCRPVLDQLAAHGVPRISIRGLARLVG